MVALMMATLILSILVHWLAKTVVLFLKALLAQILLCSCPVVWQNFRLTRYLVLQGKRELVYALLGLKLAVL